MTCSDASLIERGLGQLVIPGHSEMSSDIAHNPDQFGVLVGRGFDCTNPSHLNERSVAFELEKNDYARGVSVFSASEVAYWRTNRGATQRQMAEHMGLSLPTYKRFERGEIARPPLAYFVNASIVLDVPLERLIDQRYLQWQPLNGAQSHAEESLAEAEMRTTEDWLNRNSMYLIG